MADVDKVVRGGKVTGWQARWRDPDGRQRKKTFPTKTAATAHLATLRADVLRGQYIDLDAARRITVTEQVQKWAKSRPHNERTALRVQGMIREHIDGRPFGNRTLASLRPSDVQSWVSELSKDLAPSTVRLYLGLVRSALRSAVEDRVLGFNPATSRIALPRHQPPRVVPLTVAQVRRLANAMPSRCRAMVLVQAGLGLRLGELLALRDQDVDLEGGTVRVEWQLAKRTRDRVRPKTPRSIRTVPLPSSVAIVLKEHVEEFGLGRDGLLFVTAAGAPHWHEHYGTRVFRKAVQAAGLPVTTTSHDLRHHYASVLLASGESVIAVAERLGHEDASLVVTTYGHLMPGSEQRTRAAIDAAWCAPDVPPADGEGL